MRPGRHATIQDRRDGRFRLWVCAVLALATFTVYAQVLDNEFVNFDDPEYITTNAHVQQGLTPGSIAWAFTTTTATNWHPLTWLSHMLDWQLFGPSAGWHHLASLLLHVANTLLVFLLLQGMTGRRWPSAVVAALFALHPLHVESVAWAAERKDVLSTLFGLLAVWAYWRYTRRRRLGWYLAVAGLLALSLMAKPMLVTLPLVLLLLDIWPLGRLPLAAARQRLQKAGAADEDSAPPAPSVLGVLAEKLPLLALSAASCVITYLAQKTPETIRAIGEPSLALRAANIPVSYVAYLWKTVWPEGLAVLYPYPAGLPAWQVAGAVAILIVVTVTVLLAIRRRPYLAVGWLWFLGTLLPVIGLVQVGRQSMADRYSYIPLLGIFIMAVWGASDLTARRRNRLAALVPATAAVLLACAVVSQAQVAVWRDSITLFEHALAATRDNFVAHMQLGLALVQAGREQEALPHWSECVRIKPDYAAARNNLAIALAKQGKLAEAIREWQEAVRLNPDLAEAHYHLGLALQWSGPRDKAAYHFAEALRSRPDHVHAMRHLAWLLATADDDTLRDGPRAVELAERACDLAGQSDADMLDTLAAAYAEAGRFEEAQQAAQKAVDLARATKPGRQMAAIVARLLLYRNHKPYREPLAGAPQPPAQGQGN